MALAAGSPCRASPCSGTVFLGGSHARSRRLRDVRQDGGVLLLRKVLHHLQRPAHCSHGRRRTLLLSRLPGSLRHSPGEFPWTLNRSSFACKLRRTRVLPRPQAEPHVILRTRLASKLLRLPAGKRPLWRPARKPSRMGGES